MIVFVQPFGLNSPGGGPRILRALLQDAPQPFLSICTSPLPPPPTTIGCEVHLPVRPFLGRIERTRFARYLGHLLPSYQSRFLCQLEQLCRKNNASAIHAIPHGLDFWYAFQTAEKLRIPFYLNVHDDMTYNLANRPELNAAMKRLAQVWVAAQGRIVISEAMGKEYSRRYGKMPFSVVTDGLTETRREPRPQTPRRLRTYFAGAIHLSYQDNFKVLLEALALLQSQHPNWDISVVSRGSFLPTQNSLHIENRPWASEAEVAHDLDDVDLLYLPLPFSECHLAFSRFSLSTKLITYLGTGLPILYHGPANAAAGELLFEHQAAFTCHELVPQSVLSVLQKLPDRDRYIRNAIGLGHRQFLLSKSRERFWGLLQTSTSVLYYSGLVD